LAEIIFTQKERETITKEYISRLEKLKKQKLIKGSGGKKTLMQRVISEEDLLFTEHHLDTKEDQENFKNSSQVNLLF